MTLGSDTKVVILAAGLLFLWALLLGVVKYRQMASSPDGLAHPYTDTAHRAALLYSFATLLIATFVQLGSFSTAVNLVCAGALLVYFAAAIVSYMVHGLRRDTDNQFRPGEQTRGLHPFMWSLLLVEIGAFAVLVAGFVDAQML